MLRLAYIAKKYPKDATEVREQKSGGSVTVYKLTDLTRALRDLTDDMPRGDAASNELLQSLLDLEREARA